MLGSVKCIVAVIKTVVILLLVSTKSSFESTKCYVDFKLLKAKVGEKNVKLPYFYALPINPLSCSSSQCNPLC
jgi:hypothetical protein